MGCVYCGRGREAGGRDMKFGGKRAKTRKPKRYSAANVRCKQLIDELKPSLSPPPWA